ncbi:MAG TPA: hypothetical protein VER17_19105 [Tepidisphaeraceae bacterium]|nr:hypothetical protein [Tepidisphaeraceae bacterium]
MLFLATSACFAGSFYQQRLLVRYEETYASVSRPSTMWARMMDEIVREEAAAAPKGGEQAQAGADAAGASE